MWSVGEIFSGDVPFLAFYLDDVGLPSVFDFPLYFRIKDHLSSPGGNLDNVAAVFAQDNAYDDPTRLTTFVDNHDVRRFMSEAITRGVPERQARERLDAALSLIYTARGTPSVYYGTEIAMQGLGDPYSYELGASNREDMDFGALASSTLDERLAALAQARQRYPALTHGVQQELWRPNGGAPVMAFRRYLKDKVPVVAVLNNGDTALRLTDLPGGGIPLLGTFDPGAVAGDSGKTGKNCSKGKDNSGKCLRGIVEVTGRTTDLAVNAAGQLVGTVPARTLLAVAAPPGPGLQPNPDLANVTGLSALAGDGAVRLSWTPVSDSAVAGYRVYYRAPGETGETLYNFAPLTTTGAVVVSGLTNGLAYSFRVVTVDANGGESVGAPTVTATPDAGAVATVTFIVDARSQGAGQLEIRRFDTGTQLEYPLSPVENRQGFWTATLELPLFREIRFKFGNDAATAKNSGYEGDGQGDRVLSLNDATVTYEGVYDFIDFAAPATAVEGTVRSGDTPLEGATVDSSTDPRVFYGITFKDGSYYLPQPRSVAADLTAKAPGFASATKVGVASPATTIDFDLAVDATTKYLVDGDLSDWTAPRATLVNGPNGYDGGFGPDNLFLELRVDWDETYLYLGYRYRAAGNSAILHLDVRPGGSASAASFDAWNRLASFATPVDFFLAQYEGQSVQLREVVSNTQTSELTSGFVRATAGSAPAYSSELAIPWTTLGFGRRPDTTLNFFAGVYGGDGYGAGDILPSENSLPVATGNTIAGFDQNRAVTFQTPFAVTVTP